MSESTRPPLPRVIVREFRLHHRPWAIDGYEQTLPSTVKFDFEPDARRPGTIVTDLTEAEEEMLRQLAKSVIARAQEAVEASYTYKPHLKWEPRVWRPDEGDKL